METFILAGKAKTVFRLIELKAKLEAEKKAQNNQKRKQSLKQTPRCAKTYSLAHVVFGLVSYDYPKLLLVYQYSGFAFNSALG